MSKTVFIDAGHGGNDSGAVGKLGEVEFYEKDRNLTFALELKRILMQSGITVVMSREDDTRYTLDEVCAKEVQSGASCCISCHMDSAGTNTTASGPTMLIHSKAGENIVGWATHMLEEINLVGITSNRYVEVRKGYLGNLNLDYYFNANTKSPSMILELGFISNENNLQEHIDKSTEYAKAVSKSICKFIEVEYVEEEEASGEIKGIISIEELLIQLKQQGVENIKI